MRGNSEHTQLINRIAAANHRELSNVQALTGGDINEVYLLETIASEKLVLKLNQTELFPGIFDAEKSGLEELRKSEAFIIPEIIALGTIRNYSYILLEYIKPGKKNHSFWENFGSQLAQLHKTTQTEFGFKHNNYIGSLPQKNELLKSASDFYINNRLLPQIELARENRYDLKIPETFYKHISDLIPNEPPSLIHGDLWNGNFLINDNSQPVLIDPAVSYASREMDLAMMKLFGGFDALLFEHYIAAFPLPYGFKERERLWQLYYLLVHLNLFGGSYLSSVSTIIKDFS